MNKLIMTILALSFSCAAQAELVLITNPSNTETIDASAMSSIFLGKTKSLPSGRKVVAVMVDYEEPELDAFLLKNLGKSTSQFRAYWSRKAFTGEGVPPQSYKANQDILDLVSRNPDVIGIADPGTAKDKVRVIRY